MDLKTQSEIAQLKERINNLEQELYGYMNSPDKNKWTGLNNEESWDKKQPKKPGRPKKNG